MKSRGAGGIAVMQAAINKIKAVSTGCAKRLIRTGLL